MAYEIELYVIMIFSVATAVLLTLFALSKKRRFPWIFFIIFVLFLGGFGGVTLFAPTMFGPALDNRFLPIDIVAAPLLGWIVGLILLSKSNQDVKSGREYERTMALNEISKAYLKSANIADAAKGAINHMVDVYDADGGMFFVFDTDKKQLSVLTSINEQPRVLTEYLQRMSNDFDKFYSALELWKRDEKDPIHRLRQEGEDVLYREGYRTVIGAPVVSGQTILGMIVIYAKRKIQMSEEDRNSLNLVAFEIGLWMTQMKNIESMRRLSETQKGLLDISLLLQLELDKDKISHSIIDKLIQLVPSRDAMVYLYNPRKKMFYPADAVGKDAEAIIAEGPFPVSEAGIAGQILMAGRPEIIHDTLADGRGKQIEGTARETTAMLALPLFSKGKPLGLIELHRDHPATFTQEELQIGTLFAQQASIALENAQLLDLMEQEKDRSKLYLDLLSHDIANLNTPLYSYFDMLMKSDAPKDIKDIMQKAHAQIESMNALVSRVRKLSKGDLEDMEEIRTVMVREILDEAIKSLKGAFPNKSIDINFEIPEDDPFPARAGEMLDEIFLNILHNAVKFSSGKKVKIDITVERMEIKSKWYCAVRISDHGSGVPDKMKDDIFSGGKAVAASFARGFGIGLNMCRKLVEKYGGSIWVEDRIRGDSTKGACFVVSLPTMPPRSKD